MPTAGVTCVWAGVDSAGAKELPYGKKTPRTNAGRPSYAALLLPHRTNLHGLGQTLHPLPRQTPPQDMGAPEIQAFLIHLAGEKNVAASTQNQALSAILFLYREVLHKEIEH